DNLLFVAIEKGQVIGAVMAGYDGHRGWLYAVAVDPNERRNGIGRKLVDHAVLSLKDLGCIKINLQVRSSNAKVVAFYRNLGFKSEERISMGKKI
ncbi:GNAT family acetyltransferase, partial [Planctomycetota bacterium]